MKGKQILTASKPTLTQTGLIELGAMVFHKRTKNKLKLKEVADLLSMTVTTFIRIEKGAEWVSAGNLFKAL